MLLNVLLNGIGCSFSGNPFPVFAFFGDRDHYRKSGIVSVRSWTKHFGSCFSIYEGTHFMEEEHVRSLLADKILIALDIKK